MRGGHNLLDPAKEVVDPQPPLQGRGQVVPMREVLDSHDRREWHSRVCSRRSPVHRGNDAYQFAAAAMSHEKLMAAREHSRLRCVRRKNPTWQSHLQAPRARCRPATAWQAPCSNFIRMQLALLDGCGKVAQRTRRGRLSATETRNSLKGVALSHSAPLWNSTDTPTLLMHDLVRPY